MKKTHLIIITLIFLFSCGSLKDAGSVLRNEKTKTTDEFLVKKKDPLILPPNYEKIPEPGSINQKKENESQKIKKILKAPKEESSYNKSSSIEDSILKEIRK